MCHKDATLIEAREVDESMDRILKIPTLEILRKAVARSAVPVVAGFKPLSSKVLGLNACGL